MDVCRRYLRTTGGSSSRPLRAGAGYLYEPDSPILRGYYVFVTVAVVWFVSEAPGSPVGLVVEIAFFVIFATYCLANFARCREAHCTTSVAHRATPLPAGGVLDPRGRALD